MRGLTIIASALVLAACSGGRGGREEAPDVVIDESWPDLPDSAVFGEPMAVDVDSHGHIFILHRAGHDDTDGEGAETISEPTVFMLAANGKLLGKWGAGTFVEPHGLSVDGDDKVWITDTARQQVFRFSHEGTEELVLGERGVAHSAAYSAAQGAIVNLVRAAAQELAPDGITVNGVELGWMDWMSDRIDPTDENALRAVKVIKISKAKSEGCSLDKLLSEAHILNMLTQVWFNVVINVQLACIHNAHIHTCRNGVIEEDRVHGTADRLIAPEGE